MARTLVTRATTTVSTTAVVVLAANPKRKRAVICQTSANAVRIGDANVTATTGARLGAAGTMNDRLIFDGDAQGRCFTGDIYAIREGGTDGTCSAIEELGP